jgi:hypothetical protein
VAREKLLVDNELFLLVASTDDDLYVFAVTTLSQQLQEYTFCFSYSTFAFRWVRRSFRDDLTGFAAVFCDSAVFGVIVSW